MSDWQERFADQVADTAIAAAKVVIAELSPRVPRARGHTLVHASRLLVQPASRCAEAASVVMNKPPGRGLGNLLLEHFVRRARIKGPAGLTAQILDHGEVPREIFIARGYPVETTLQEYVQELTIHFREHEDEPPSQPTATGTQE